MPPLSRHAIAAAVHFPIQSDTGTDNHRKYGIHANPGTIRCLRHRHAIGVVGHPHRPLQPGLQILIQALTVKPYRIGIFHFTGIRRQGAGNTDADAAALACLLFYPLDQRRDRLHCPRIIIARRRDPFA